jgi:hypothetical protein
MNTQSRNSHILQTLSYFININWIIPTQTVLPRVNGYHNRRIIKSTSFNTCSSTFTNHFFYRTQSYIYNIWTETILEDKALLLHTQKSEYQQVFHNRRYLFIRLLLARISPSEK